MTISELIERLEEVRDNVGGGVEIRLATQPSYPLAYEIAGVADPEDIESDEVATLRETAERLEGMIDDAAESDNADRWEELSTDLEDVETEIAKLEEDATPVVWLVEGSNTDDPYGVPRDVWDVV